LLTDLGQGAGVPCRTLLGLMGEECG